MPNEPKLLYAGKHLELVAIGNWEFARRPNAASPVGIIALTQDNLLILISQFRLPVQKTIIEIPAGLVGDTDSTESWQLAANRELLEETGYSADSFTLLNEGPSSAGLTSECIKLARAHNPKKIAPQSLDGDEQITLHEIPLPEVPAFLNHQRTLGHLIDNKVYAALYFLLNA